MHKTVLSICLIALYLFVPVDFNSNEYKSFSSTLAASKLSFIPLYILKIFTEACSYNIHIDLYNSLFLET